MDENDTNVPERKKKKNWTDAESLILDEICTQNLWIDYKFNDSVSNAKKKEFWKEVSSKITALNICPRSPNSCRKRWQNKKNKATTTVRHFVKESNSTGGGPPPPQPTEDEYRIAATQPISKTQGIVGGLDTDNFPAAGEEITAVSEEEDETPFKTAFHKKLEDVKRKKPMQKATKKATPDEDADLKKTLMNKQIEAFQTQIDLLKMQKELTALKIEKLRAEQS